MPIDSLRERFALQHIGNETVMTNISLFKRCEFDGLGLEATRRISLDSFGGRGKRNTYFNAFFFQVDFHGQV
jgi:hypothetical protein